MKILRSLLTIGAVATLAISATGAYFSDNETSNGNTFAAGSLDLTVDGNNNTNTVKFNLSNLKPGDQPHGSYTLANVGTINGYLDLENISVTSQENGCTGAETAAGDTTCNNPGPGEGELQNVLNLRLFIDYNGNGWIDAGDKVFYNGLLKDVPSHFELDEPLAAMSSVKIVALLDWWPTPLDNQAQTDSAVLNMTFELAQTTGQ
jgi:predicted ribosomally synthesized peptide with SipW-like signal peptide